MLTNLPIWVIVILIIAAAWYYWRPARFKSTSSLKGGVLTVYTRDLTELAHAGKLDPVVGRETEIERVVHILSRRTKNNPLLLGEPGVGKTAVVEGLARRMAASEVPEILRGRKVLALDLTGLIAGTKYRGEFEERMKRLTDEITRQSRQIILFIDEVHMISETRGGEGALYLSDILKPALSRGDLQMIGATTTQEYERLIKPDDALNRRLQPVLIGEPTAADALAVLRGLQKVYEAHHKVHYQEAALEAAVRLSEKYIKGRYLPDKAIDLIDEAGAMVAMEKAHEMRHAAGLLYAAGEKKRLEELAAVRERLEAECERLRVLEKDLSSESELADLRERCEHLVVETKRLEQDEEAVRRGEIPRVTAEDIRVVVADWAGLSFEEIN